MFEFTLRFIGYQSAVLAAAVIGTFSWNAVSDAYWLASAFWYCSLVLAILGLALAAQEVAVLDLIRTRQSAEQPITSKADMRRYLPLILTESRSGDRESERRISTESNDVGVWSPKWKMVFAWQCPIMFLSYSVCFYLAGLTNFVCTPLIRRESWNTNSKVSCVVRN